MAVFGYLPKLKRGLVQAFGANFLHDFFHKNVPYLIRYGQSFNAILFSFSRFEAKCVIKFLFRQMMTS